MMNYRTVKKALLGGAAAAAMVVAVSAPANSTDLLPGANLANWTGWYFGIHIGAGDPDIDGRFNPSELPGDKWNESGGLVGGGHIGYNWQTDGFVWGLELDVTATGFDADACNACVNGSESATVEIDMLGSIRARAGMLFDPQNLAYVTGGLAYRDASWSASNSGLDGKDDIDDFGGVVGVGWEHKVTQNASLRVEGLWYFFPSGDAPADCCNTIGSSVDSDPLVLRVGASYHF